MRGARERNTLRWDAQRALLDDEIARLRRELAEAAPDSPAAATLRQQLDDALRRRRALGPSPRPKMG
jgi:hypothetical protein